MKYNFERMSDNNELQKHRLIKLHVLRGGKSENSQHSNAPSIFRIFQHILYPPYICYAFCKTLTS